MPAPETRPAWKFVQVDEGSAGQRLDNFLLRELKGVPKTHVYRVIRAGEVRVSAKAAPRPTAWNWATVRIPPVRVAAKPDDAPAARRAEFPVVFEDEHLLVIDKPAGVGQSTAARASASASLSSCAAPGPPPISWNSSTGSTRKPRAS